LEQNDSFRHDDPAFIHLKRQLVLAIAELEIQKDLKISVEPTEPVHLVRVRKSAEPDSSPVLELCPKEK